MQISLVKLRDDLVIILETEQSQKPNWDMVAEMCTNWIDLLNKSNCVNLIDDFIYHYIEDFEVRQYDEKYARQQHKRLETRIAPPAISVP